MITLTSLEKRYGSFIAVNKISLSVKQGEIFGFLGMNGAGKTTTLRMIMGILKPTSGAISIGGVDLARDPLKAKAIMGYIPDRPFLYPKLTGREYLRFVGDLYHVPEDEVEPRIDALIADYRMGDRQFELIESYSHGMKQRIATCGALLHQPKVLVVDEPMVGLDPYGAKHLKESLKKYSKDGMTILLSTHSLDVAEELAHRLAIIHRGAIVALGTLDELRATASLPQGKIEDVFLKLTGADLRSEEGGE